MARFLPEELIASVRRKWRFRDVQIRQLTTLLLSATSSPPILVVYGQESTGKTSTTRAILETASFPHAYVSCRECITVRHLFQRTLSVCREALQKNAKWEKHGRCDHLSTLAVYLQDILKGLGENFVLVLDGIDHQKGASPTLLPALARLGDKIQNLTVLLILKSPPRALSFQKAGVPYIHFSPYTRQQMVSIVAKEPPQICAALPTLADKGLLQKWYTLFVTTVHDSLVHPVSNTLPLLQSVCEELWPQFVAPFINEEQPSGNNAQWTFSKLVVRNRALFQRTGEAALADSIIPHLSSFSASSARPVLPSEPDESPQISTERQQTSKPPLIPYLPALILTAAYLASHTSPRFDVVLFSKLSTASKKTSRQRKRKVLQSTSKHANSLSHRTPRALIAVDAELPRPFPLERLLAILRAIHPAGIRKRPLADQVLPELSTLEKLRLVVPASGGPASVMADAGERWRVNVGKEWVASVAVRFGIQLGEWVVNGQD